MIRYGERGLKLLGDDNECMEAALMNTCIAYSSSWKGDKKRHEDYIHRNIEFVKKLDYSREIRIVYDHISQYYETNDIETSLKWIRELEKRAREKNDIRGIATALIGEGAILLRKGDFQNALSFINDANRMSQSIGDEMTSWECYGLMNALFITLGNIDKAKMGLEEILKIENQMNSSIGICHCQIGIISMCQNQWEESIRNFQHSLILCQDANPSMITYTKICLTRSYIRNGDYDLAIQLLVELADTAIETNNIDLFSTVLSSLEHIYNLMQTPGKFTEFCDLFREKHQDADAKFPLLWYVEPCQPPKGYSNLIFSDEFSQESINQYWEWINEVGDSSYQFNPENGIEIHAANGRILFARRADAPRLMRTISGDFTIEAFIFPASDDKPQMGGLLIWKDKDNFLRFEKGVDGEREMRLQGNVNGEWQIAGRGLLPASENDETYLRLERSEDEFTSYCSVDGENWFTCGKITLPMEDPIQVGIHAIGMIDRTIYCGEYKEGAATLFRNFRIWNKG